MAKRSAIAKLDPRVQAAVDAAIREGRATIDDIVVLIKSYGETASRSSVGRYVKNATAQLSRYREAQEVAKVWIGKLNEEPEGDVARLLGEMLRTVAFQQIGQMSGEDQVKPMDIMLIAKGLEHLSKAQRTDVARVVFIREKAKVLTNEVKALETKAERGGKITLDDLKAIREGVYGLSS